MSSEPVFDFHARLGPQPSALEGLLGSMDANGIDRAAVCAGGVIDPYLLSRQVLEGGSVDSDPDNDAVLAAARQSDGRLVPFFFANPRRNPDHYRRNGEHFRGLEISPAVHGIGLADPRTTALVAVAAEFGHPVYAVCLGRAGSTVHDFASLAKGFPETTFVLGHCGFVGIDFHAVQTVEPHDNIMAETSGCYAAVARAAVRHLGPERLLFGSEYPVQSTAAELTKMRELGLDSQAWRQVTWQNASRLLTPAQ